MECMEREIETPSGFKCTINENVLDDMELLDLMIEIDSDTDNQLIYYNRIMNKLLSKDTKKDLYDHIRTEDGRVPSESFKNELLAIFDCLKNKKK